MQKRPWLWINRTISTSVLTPLLARTSLTPNQITVASLAAGIVSGIFLSLGTYAAGLWGVIFYELASLLDNVDGDIARLKNLQSELGAKLDIFCDIVTDSMFFIGIFLGAHGRNIPGPLGILFLLAVIGLAIHYFLMYKEKVGARHALPLQEAVQAASEGEISWVVVGLGLLGWIYWLAWLLPVYMNALWILNLTRKSGQA